MVTVDGCRAGVPAIPSLRRGGTTAMAQSPGVALPKPHAPCKRSPHRCRPRPAARKAAGPVAQWLEPTAHNGLVAGSSPAGPTTKSMGYRQLFRRGGITAPEMLRFARLSFNSGCSQTSPRRSMRQQPLLLNRRFGGFIARMSQPRSVP